MPQEQPVISVDSQETSGVSPLARALDLNEAATETVEETAAELVMINAVLKQELPDDVQVGDVAHALQRTEELEVKINDATQDLTQVNEVLTQEIVQRMDLERELAQTKAELAEAKSGADQA